MKEKWCPGQATQMFVSILKSFRKHVEIQKVTEEGHMEVEHMKFVSRHFFGIFVTQKFSKKWGKLSGLQKGPSEKNWFSLLWIEFFHEFFFYNAIRWLSFSVNYADPCDLICWARCPITLNLLWKSRRVQTDEFSDAWWSNKTISCSGFRDARNKIKGRYRVRRNLASIGNTLVRCWARNFRLW